MGFSLAMFFGELIDIFDAPFLSLELKLEMLEECTKKAIIYAEECGYLK